MKHVNKAKRDCKYRTSPFFVISHSFELKYRFLFDYGGTLIPHGKPPTPADLKRVVELLSKLSEDPRNSVYVISGRTKTHLDTDLGSLPNLGLR